MMLHVLAPSAGDSPNVVCAPVMNDDPRSWYLENGHLDCFESTSCAWIQLA